MNEFLKNRILIQCTYTYNEIYTHNKVLFNHKKNEILPMLTTWLGIEGIIPNEISQKRTKIILSHGVLGE